MEGDENSSGQINSHHVVMKEYFAREKKRISNGSIEFHEKKFLKCAAVVVNI